MSDASSSGRGFPPWVDDMRIAFQSGAASQFVLHGNIHDLMPWPPDDDGHVRYTGLAAFLEDAVFRRFDVVLVYDRGRGLVVARGEPHWQAYLESADAFLGGRRTGARMPSEPEQALQLMDGFVRYAVARRSGPRLKVALIVHYAEFVLPRAGAAYVAGPGAANLVRVIHWATDPAIRDGYVATVLVADQLGDLAEDLVANPHSVELAVPLPSELELRHTLDALAEEEPGLDQTLRLPRDAVAARAVGLSRVALRNMLAQARVQGLAVDGEVMARARKRLIEAECAGLVEFIETTRTLNDVAGHVEAKRWLRDDAALLRGGHTRSLPMGYLFCGRVGTGKTYLATCWAGEIGIPCVVLKNFRDRWQGSTESNLQKIFEILRALGQVMVFVDEADQVTGQRGGDQGDNGVSGRVYAMLAQEMARTENRGRILWVFATSRPDLLEVDLKRTGRLDVRIPLFPPRDASEQRDLFMALARKSGLRLAAEDVPTLPDGVVLGGNEMEAMLVRACRRLDLAADGEPDQRNVARVLGDVAEEFRPSAEQRRLELMDLLAALECTDARFLPADLRDVSHDVLRARVDALQRAGRA